MHADINYIFSQILHTYLVDSYKKNKSIVFF